MKSAYRLILLLLLFVTPALHAQNAILKGMLRTDAGLPPDVATVELLTVDGNPLLSTFSDSIGQYYFPVERGRSYRISASGLGYTKVQSNTLIIVDDTLSAPNLILQQDVQNLNGVTITTVKKLYEMKPDKLVMNIENNPIATGNSVFQVVRQAPGVSADQYDNLKLKGAAAQIYINGRPSFLTGAQLTEYLKNLPADMVATVELITQPSGKYDAAGTAGIININLKKNKAYGLNGVLSLGGGMGKYPKANAGLNMNYRKGKVNVFGNVSPSYSESYNKLNYNSIIPAAGTIYQDRENYWHPKTSWLPYTIGTDYYINDNSILGILVNGEYTKSCAITDNASVFKNASMQPYQYINSIRKDNSSVRNAAYNINYKNTWDSMGSELSVNADYGRYASKSLDVNENSFLDAEQQVLRPVYTFRQNQPSHISLAAATADYTRYITPKTKVNIGGKYSYVSSDNNLAVDSIADKDWVYDANRSNHFRYKEQIVAGYINWSQEWKKTSLQLGLRGEQTRGTGRSLTLDQENKIRYFSLFPTAYLSQVLDSNNTLNASYGRRINRPSYQSLNPFVFYIDPYTLFAGNPNLKPSYAHSFEIKHSYKQVLFTTLSYRFSKADAIMTILQNTTTGRVKNITQNAGNSQYLGLDIFAQLQPTKWWSMENSMTLAVSHSTSEVPGYRYDTRAFLAYMYTNHNFTVKQDLKLQVNFYYSLPTRDGLARLQSGYGLSLGLQQQFWNNRATLKCNVNNIIGMNAYRAHYQGEGLDIRWRNEWEGRKCSISFSYKLGSQQVKAARERQTASEEKSRIGM